ncbi:MULTISPECIES: hypothetical protein [unclassified Paenibacillus]|uniref:hypothetical protein n=1 Tax=unclassified Paenibacillus TaxID=185978 RepID=UPI003837499D
MEAKKHIELDGHATHGEENGFSAMTQAETSWCLILADEQAGQPYVKPDVSMSNLIF